MSISLTTPAMLFPAVSLLLLAYTNRFVTLASLIRNFDPEHSTENTQQQIANLRKRIYLIRRMQEAGVISFCLCVVSMMALYWGYEATVDFINQFRVDYGIIGISAIDQEDGSLLDYDYQEVRVAQSIISNSREVFLAADHAKFGRSAMVRLGNITQVDRLFSDAEPPKSIKALLKEHSVKFELCE